MPENEWLDVGAVADNLRQTQVEPPSSRAGVSRKLNQRLRTLVKPSSARLSEEEPKVDDPVANGSPCSRHVPSSARPRTGDGTDGLSPVVVRYNRTMEGKVAQALEKVGDKPSTQHNTQGLGGLRPTHRLESMFAEIHADCENLREQHLSFVASKEKHWKTIAAQYEEASATRDAAQSMAARALPARAMVNIGKPAPRVTTHGSDTNIFAAVKAATAYRNVREETPLVEKTFKTLTRAQERAIAQFDDLDDGKADFNDVFDVIPSDARRVETKLDYFRERCQLLLPRIEEHFMHIDDTNGCLTVDIGKVRAARRKPAKDSKGQGQASSSTVSTKPSTAETGELSLVPSKCTLVTCSSWESLEQRAARLVQQGQIRDFRLATARDAERTQLAERRQAQLQAHHSKAARKALATRDRTLFTWIVAAIATEVIMRLWKGFVTCYSEPGTVNEDASQRYTARYWRSTISTAQDQIPLIPPVKRLLLVALMRKCEGERRAERREHALRTWWQILRPMRFAAILCRRRRLNSYAEVVKDILNTSWRGYELRASLKVYLQQMSFLQFSWRCCGRLRNHCKYYIYMPTLWEVETTILGEIIGLPPSQLAAELEQHRTCWDLKQRMLEVRQISDVRQAWRDWLEEKVSFANRVTTYLEHSAKQRKNRLTVQNIEGGMSGSHRGSSNTTYISGSRRGSGNTPSAPSSSERPNMIKFMRRREKPMALFSVFGKASPRCGKFDSRMQRTVHPLMNVIDKYRLAPEIRNEIVGRMLHDNTERWWIRYQDYKEQCKVFKKLWLNWRLEVRALGPHNRSVWPMTPNIPRFPHELTKVDEKELQTKVLEALKSTQAGQLL